MEGKCCGLKPNPMRTPSGIGSGSSGCTGYRMYECFTVGVVPSANRLSMYAWVISNGRNQTEETRHENKGSRYVKSARFMIPWPRYSFRLQRVLLICDLSKVIEIRKRPECVAYFSLEWIKCAQLTVYWFIYKRALICELFNRTWLINYRTFCPIRSNTLGGRVDNRRDW